jgi:putative FmdB family regulatory protein
MPTYEYLCDAGHAFERIQKMSEAPLATCTVCGAPAKRKVSGGQGLIFKGSGFYITDYGKDGKGPRKADADGAAPKADAPAAKADAAKPAAPASTSGGSTSGGSTAAA